jgi:hypothetical protein
LGKIGQIKGLKNSKKISVKVIENLITIPQRLKQEDKQAKEKLKQKTFNEKSAEIKSIKQHISIIGSLRELICYFNQMGEIVKQFILSY